MTGCKTAGGSCDLGKWERPDSVSAKTHESRLLQLDELMELLTRSEKASTTCVVTPRKLVQGVSTTSHRTNSAPSTHARSRCHTTGPSDVLSCSDTDQTTPIQAANKPRPKGCRTRIRGTAIRHHPATGISSTHEDRRKKNELLQISVQKEEATAHVLNLELDGERERRWKAEQAAARLMVHMRNLQGRLTETDKKHEVAILQASNLKKALENETMSAQTLRQQVEQLQNDVKEGQRAKELLTDREIQQQKLLRDSEENYRTIEWRRIEEATDLRSSVRETEALAAGHVRELELLRKNLKQSESQVQHLRELFVKKDEEWQKRREGTKPLNSKDIQEMVAGQLREERIKMVANHEQIEIRLSEQQQAYRKLEDEFRMALEVEASRYNELEKNYRELCGEFEATRQTAVAAVQKEHRAAVVVGELTTIVTDLKVRLKELCKSKQKMGSQLRARVSELETLVTGRNKMEVKLLSVQEDNSKLQAQVMAEVSVINGLQDERKLWGQELAHQGASLAKEKGRMETQLESLTGEIQSLREQLLREKDAVRVKEMQLADHGHSLQQLKQAVANKEREREEERREIGELRLRLEQEETLDMDLQDELASLVERKEQLKAELAAALDEKTHWKTKFSQLQEQWEGKVSSIGNLEKNLSQLQESFNEKERLLISERDKALASVRSVNDRVKACDDAFREQLQTKDSALHDHLRIMSAEKQKIVDLANQKVERVEEEMRALLEEVSIERRNMEAKVAKITSVLQDFQRDIN